MVAGRSSKVYNGDASDLLEFDDAISELSMIFLRVEKRMARSQNWLHSSLLCCQGQERQEFQELLELISCKVKSIQSQDNGKIDVSTLKMQDNGKTLRELLRSPVLIELGCGSQCAFKIIHNVLQLSLPGLEGVDLDISCPICLEILFRPLGLRCGHVFCKSCASKAKLTNDRCAVCRKMKAYDNAVTMPLLGLILKKHDRACWEARHKQEVKEIESQYLIVP